MTNIVHHLHECNKEDDGSQCVDEEIVLISKCSIKEESSSRGGLVQEITSKYRNPSEDLETSVTLENEQSDGLLEEKTNDNSGPGRQ